jgi:hypothetical protein
MSIVDQLRMDHPDITEERYGLVPPSAFDDEARAVNRAKEYGRLVDPARAVLESSPRSQPI